MSSITKENYLKALFFLSEKDDEISLSDLGKAMNVSKPTVSDMAKKLEQKGWIIYTKYKPVKITAAGKKAAALVIRKHRLSEMFLSKVMGFGWEEVHEIAEELEHVKSDKFFDRMNEIMGFPPVDPHGSPIPDKDGNMILNDYIPLSEVSNHCKVIFKAIRDGSTELLLFLNRKELSLGIEISVSEIEPYDKSVSVSYGNVEKLQLSHSIAIRLLVELV